jgi:Ca2+-transporting ATPase
MLFTALVLTQLLHAFDFRDSSKTVWHPRSLNNRWLVLSLGGSMALQAAIIYVPVLSGVFRTAPLSAIQWAAVLGAGVVAVVVMDASKILTARRSAASQGARR